MFCVWSRYIGNIIHYVYSDPRFQMVNVRRGGGRHFSQEHLENAAGLLLQIKLFSYN